MAIWTLDCTLKPDKMNPFSGNGGLKYFVFTSTVRFYNIMTYIPAPPPNPMSTSLHKMVRPVFFQGACIQESRRTLITRCEIVGWCVDICHWLRAALFGLSSFFPLIKIYFVCLLCEQKPAYVNQRYWPRVRVCQTDKQGNILKLKSVEMVFEQFKSFFIQCTA